ncbi:MAG: glycine--tRNA ligase, partial [Candidatus Colwellbacteria bacterium RIFCSPLOWO2_01_FULL_48_10]
NDPLAECKKCKNRFRADQLADAKKCPNCDGELGAARQFNLMLKTFLGPAEEKANEVYFRPETAQAMFVNFKNILDSMRPRLPFGIAQIGKAFRNEITPGNFIFRTREFEQMEIEYFFNPAKRDSRISADLAPINADGEEGWQEVFEYWRKEMREWMRWLGLSESHIHELDVPQDELAHYSKRTIDFEYDFPFGRKELYGLAYRTDFDLKNHQERSGESLSYRDPITNEVVVPHVVEPTFGVDRTVLAVLCESYVEDGDPVKPDGHGAGRVFLKLPPQLAPYKAAVFPLLANKPQLVEAARKIYADLKKDFAVAFDDRGNVGKRYYAQDEIGTPYCITVDFDTLGEAGSDKKDTVTVRDRDTAKQERIKISALKAFIAAKI